MTTAVRYLYSVDNEENLIDFFDEVASLGTGFDKLLYTTTGGAFQGYTDGPDGVSMDELQRTSTLYRLTIEKVPTTL